MCGIGGILTKRRGAVGGSEDVAGRLGGSLVHRGRSGQGTFTEERVSLHCARHAVIAVEEARQPLHDTAGDLVMVGNGEVLNYRELAMRIPPHRCRRLPPGDLHVALELFAAHGETGFEDLRGPFALAVWDRPRGELTLVRDRLGERPLYYYDTPDVFMFASEVRCLEAALRGGVHLDETSILSFVGLGRTTGDRTLFREIKALPPGGVLQVRVGKDSHVRRQLAPIPTLRGRDAEAGCEEEVLRLIDQANRRVLVADCPVAVGFSGGIDSSVVLKAALEGADVAAAITVFSADRQGVDENLRRARAVAKVIGVDLLEVPFTIPSFDDTTELLDTTLDQPAAEPLVLHNDALHAAARDYAPVLLGGHGADEVFGGYARYASVMNDADRSTTLQWMGASQWERWRRAAGWKQFLDEVVGEEFASSVDVPTDALERPFPYEFAEDSDPVLFGQALDLFRLMCFDNFRATDENGIARGVEVRSPFFDIDLIAGVFALPVHRRIVPTTPKHLLQQVFAGTPLEKAFLAGKVGFDDYFPYPDWIADNWKRFSASIAKGPLVDMGLLRGTVLHRLHELDWRLLWRLFTLSTWLIRRRII